MPDLHYVHVIGRDKTEAKESDFYPTVMDAEIAAHFMTEMKKEKREPKKNVGYDYLVYTVPADVYWEQMYVEGEEIED